MGGEHATGPKTFNRSKTEALKMEQRGEHTHLINGHLTAALAPVDLGEHSLELRNTLVRGDLQRCFRQAAATRSIMLLCDCCTFCAAEASTIFCRFCLRTGDHVF